jgi:hypothetical protein
MLTDWIISQPTRRYFAAVDYGNSASSAKIVYNVNSSTLATGSGVAVNSDISLPYAGPAPVGSTGAGILILQQKSSGPQACLTGATNSIFDREEVTSKSGAAFSPGGGDNPIFCGEVATLSWGGSPLNASLTNSSVTPKYLNGWASFTLDLGTGPEYGLPITGFAGISASSGTQGYGITYPLRW